MREANKVKHVPNKEENHDKIKEGVNSKINERMDVEESNKEHGVETKKTEKEN